MDITGAVILMTFFKILHAYILLFPQGAQGSSHQELQNHNK